MHQKWRPRLIFTLTTARPTAPVAVIFCYFPFFLVFFSLKKRKSCFFSVKITENNVKKRFFPLFSVIFALKQRKISIPPSLFPLAASYDHKRGAVVVGLFGGVKSETPFFCYNPFQTQQNTNCTFPRALELGAKEGP